MINQSKSLPGFRVVTSLDGISGEWMRVGQGTWARTEKRLRVQARAVVARQNSIFRNIFSFQIQKGKINIYNPFFLLGCVADLYNIVLLSTAQKDLKVIEDRLQQEVHLQMEKIESYNV